MHVIKAQEMIWKVFLGYLRVARDCAVGVADGVGGWNNEGIDPSYFSKVLMESCCRVSTRKSVNLTNPVQILTRALKEVQWFHSKSYGKLLLIIMQ